MSPLCVSLASEPPPCIPTAYQHALLGPLLGVHVDTALLHDGAEGAPEKPNIRPISGKASFKAVKFPQSRPGYNDHRRHVRTWITTSFARQRCPPFTQPELAALAHFDGYRGEMQDILFDLETAGVVHQTGGIRGVQPVYEVAKSHGGRWSEHLPNARRWAAAQARTWLPTDLARAVGALQSKKITYLLVRQLLERGEIEPVQIGKRKQYKGVKIG